MDLIVDLDIVSLYACLYFANSCINLSKSVADSSEHCFIKSSNIVCDLVLDSTLIKSSGSKEAYVIISGKGIVIKSVFCFDITKSLVSYKVILDVTAAVIVNHVNKCGSLYCVGFVSLISLVKLKLLIEMNRDYVVLILVEHFVHFNTKILGGGELGGANGL